MIRKPFSIVAVLVLPAISFLPGCGGEEPGQAEQIEERPAVEATAGAAGTDESGEGEVSAPTDAKQAIAKTLGIDLADLVRDESGLEWVVRQEGTGEVPKKGERIKAHYTGYLLDGKKFDSSVDRGAPFEVEIGVGRVIRGWDIAFTSMREGEKRVLIIPPELGYGARGAGGVVPPNATLVFDVELLTIVK